MYACDWKKGVCVCVCVCPSSVVMAAFRHHRDNEGMYSGCVDESVVTSSLTLTLWSAHGFSSLQQHRSGHSLPSLLLQVCVVWTLSESQPCSCTEVHTENHCFYITDTEPLLSVFVSLKVLCCNLGLIFFFRFTAVTQSVHVMQQLTSVFYVTELKSHISFIGFNCFN